LPEDKPGALLELLEQFATRKVNLSLIHSRPVGDGLGRYRFIIDLEGHIEDEAVADALLGLKRFSPRVLFLGSYPSSADGVISTEPGHLATSENYEAARAWLRSIKEEIG
jgi:prephenate dehydratase